MRRSLAAFVSVVALLGAAMSEVDAAPFAYVTLDANLVGVVDSATNGVTTIPVGTGPSGVAALPSGARVYVTNNGADSVSVINVSDNTVVATVPVGTHPGGVVSHPGGAFVYVGNNRGLSISVISTVANTVVATIPAPIGVGPVAVHPAGTFLYAASGNPDNFGADGAVSIFNTATYALVTKVALPGAPSAIAVHPGGALVYVALSSANGVAVIDVASKTLALTIPVGQHPTGVAVDPAGTFVYVANQRSNNVSVINAGTNTVEATIAVGANPEGLAVHPDGRRVYVANFSDGTISVIDGVTQQVTANIAVPSLPRNIAFAVIQQLGSLASATLWVGLKNSDDQGTQFDLRAEVYVNDTLISDGVTRCVMGVTRNPSRAKEVAAAFGAISDGGLEPGDIVSLKILTRIGTNPDDTKCPGHNNAVGLRLYYDAVNRPSRFGAEITPDPLTDFFLRSDVIDFLDQIAPTASTAKFKDSPSLNFSGGNPWKEIGIWSMTIP